MAALIVLAVIVVIIAAVLSVSATFTVTYTDRWQTKISILCIEKEIELTKILDFILFPQNKANQVKAKKEGKKKEPRKKAQPKPAEAFPAPSASEPDGTQAEKKQSPAPAQKQAKPNYLKSLWEKEGVVGIMSLVSNMLQSASSAVTTLIRGFHIYSLYVKLIVGGSDAHEIARAYGRICGFYYPLKGAVLSGMKVDNYDDLIYPDFIAPCNEYGFQFIGSVSVALLLKVALSAGKTFLVNLIKNK